MGVYRTTEEWRVIIEEQRRSGLNQTAFCRLHAITRSAFFNARQRLYSTNVKLTAFIPALPPTGTTTPVTAAGQIQVSTTPLPAISKALSSQRITLELPHCTLRLESDISPRWLATLIREMAP